MQKNTNRYTSITLHKTKVQVNKTLNKISDSLNLIEEKVGNTIEHIHMGDNFLNTTLIVQTLR